MYQASNAFCSAKTTINPNAWMVYNVLVFVELWFELTLLTACTVQLQ